MAANTKKERDLNNRMTCEMNGDDVTFSAQTRLHGDAPWETLASKTFSYASFSDQFPNGETIRAYGLRAWLADRTSQFKGTISNAALLDVMENYFNQCLAAGQWNMPRAAGSPQVDRVLVLMISKMKNCGSLVAEANLKKLTPEQRSAIKERYADLYAEAEQELREAKATELGLEDLFAERSPSVE